MGCDIEFRVLVKKFEVEEIFCNFVENIVRVKDFFWVEKVVDDVCNEVFRGMVVLSDWLRSILVVFFRVVVSELSVFVISRLGLFYGYLIKIRGDFRSLLGYSSYYNGEESGNKGGMYFVG